MRRALSIPAVVPAALLVAALVLTACDTSDRSGTSSAEQGAPSTDGGAAPVALPRSEAAIPDELAAVTSDWNTDFSMSSIDLGELHVGIPVADPRDRIPPIDDPSFESVSTAGEWIADPEPGALLTAGPIARFYPLSILTRHEVVNDELDGMPVVVTYCPLCNTAVAYDAGVDGETLRFGVSGLLRQSDLVMWDRQTETLWQQITGEAIVGELTGTRLEPVPTSIVSWSDFSEAHPDGEVLAFDQGFGIEYGANPYVGYSSSRGPISGFFDGEPDDRFPALSRVVGVTIAEVTVAYPFERIQPHRVVNDRVGDQPVTVWWGAPSTADALDTALIASGQAVGTGVAYLAELDGLTLTFDPIDHDRFQDRETGTTWSLLGRAIEGPLAGSTLTPAPHRNEFWFAFAAFFPDARVWEA